MWEWKQPEGHEDQPTTEWWFEQVAATILTRIGMRAAKRGDRQTLRRIMAIVEAGADQEGCDPTPDRPHLGKRF